jgi:outer membrane protein TolC
MTNASRKRAVTFQILMVIGMLFSAQALVLLTTSFAFAQDRPKTQSAKSQLSEPLALPESPAERAQKDRTALPLSLKELTKLALLNNLDIAISDTNEDIINQQLLAAYGNYDPTFTMSGQYGQTKRANTSSYISSDTGFSVQKNAQWSLGQFQQGIKATGGTFTATLSGGRSDSNITSSLFNPQYNAAMSFQYTQPLIQNLKIDQNRMQIKLVNLNIKTNDSAFRQQVNEIIASVQTQYWILVSAMENYNIARQSVSLARLTLQNNQKKVAIGTLAALDVTSAESQLASSEVQLIQAEENINSVENTVRNLVSKDRDAEIWSKVVVPTDSPEFKERRLDLNGAIDTALKNRPELEQQDLKLQQQDMNLQLLQNSKKWKLDFTGSFGTNGTAGPYYLDPRTGQQSLPDQVGGFGTSYKNLFTSGLTNWSVGLNAAIPLRRRSLDSQIAQNRIQKQQYLMQRKKQEQSIVVEVRNAVQSLETKKKSVEQAEVATRYAKEQLEGEQKRFEAGLSNTFLVLDAQNKLAAAQYQRLQSLIAYKQAVITADSAMYSLLESSDFEVAKSTGNSGKVPDFK